jgi:hypothetical protein
VDAIVGLAAVLGLAVVVVWFVLYRWSGARGSGEVAAGTVAEGTEVWGDFLVRTYRGHEQSDAIASYVKDAETLAQRGYAPAGQSWGDGQWDGGMFFIALILSLFGIGLIMLAYMAIIRPDGTLCVTYRLRAA